VKVCRHTRGHHARLAERKAFAADATRTKDGAVVQAHLKPFDPASFG
jgi:hypothetical protein